MTFTAHFPNGRRPAGGYSPATSIGPWVFTSGHVGSIPETGAVPGEDIRSQTAQTMENLRASLAAAGATFADVVKAVVYLTRAEDLSGMDEVYRTYFGDVLPARATVTIAALARPDFCVEIDLTAHRATDN